MPHISWLSWLTWLLKANAVVWLINALLLAILILSGSTLTGLIFSGFFSKMTLLETGAAFLVGGARAFSGSVLPSKAKEYILKSDEKWSMEKLRNGEKAANKYIIFAVILFVESLLISLFVA